MPEEVLALVQGIMPASIEEFRVANSLTKFGWEYEYQYSVMGGRNLRGGSVPDFLVYTAPLNTLLYVQSDYYHGSKVEQTENFMRQLIVSELDFVIQLVFGEDLETQEESDSTILKVLGRNQ